MDVKVNSFVSVRTCRTILLVTIFSQFMHNVKVPLPGYNKEKGRYVARYPVCRYFPVSREISCRFLNI